MFFEEKKKQKKMVRDGNQLCKCIQTHTCTEQSCSTQLTLSRQKAETPPPSGPWPSNTPSNDTLSFPVCVNFSINKKESLHFDKRG